MKILWSQEGADADSAQNPTHIGRVIKSSRVLQHRGRGPLQKSCFVELSGLEMGSIDLSGVQAYGYRNLQTIINLHLLGAHSQKCNYNMRTPQPLHGKREGAWFTTYWFVAVMWIPESCIFHVFAPSNISLDCRRSFLLQDAELRLSHVHFNKSTTHHHTISPMLCNLQCHCAWLESP